ncbi:hypothetical protein DASC09_053130 [Saccharomycopsis crataegensis]|uniref:Uncharacterized protein n=1 Tax=Saccharomycopsis crataegensis TaxID=43959 RepID=A0AAV5QT21_9ASCO|nr:hypothetical protein DASC09_053130 [Saccharomycopsis crataegensis]
MQVFQIAITTFNKFSTVCTSQPTWVWDQTDLWEFVPLTEPAFVQNLDPIYVPTKNHRSETPFDEDSQTLISNIDYNNSKSKHYPNDDIDTTYTNTINSGDNQTLARE